MCSLHGHYLLLRGGMRPMLHLLEVPMATSQDHTLLLELRQLACNCSLQEEWEDPWILRWLGRWAVRAGPNNDRLGIRQGEKVKRGWWSPEEDWSDQSCKAWLCSSAQSKRDWGTLIPHWMGCSVITASEQSCWVLRSFWNPQHHHERPVLWSNWLRS